MKAVLGLLSVLLLTTTGGVYAQTPAAAPPDFQIIKYSWSKDRIAWERDPFAKVEDVMNDPLRNSTARERRSGSILRERDAKEQESAKTRPPAPPRYAFNYKLAVHNTGSKAIREIDWDYVFTDTVTGEELGRREFTSVEKIGAGKRKDLSIYASTPPAQRISVYTLGKKESDGLLGQVVIVRILYDDGSAWQPL